MEERIAVILKELVNYKDGNMNNSKREAQEWLAFGFIDDMEIWDWVCNGYVVPERVAYLKGQGQEVLTATNYTESLILEKYKDLVDIEIKEEMETININSIEVKDKNKGTGTAIFSDICDIADKLNKSIVIYPTSEKGSNLERLISFYSRWDFVEGVDNQLIRCSKG